MIATTAAPFFRIAGRVRRSLAAVGLGGLVNHGWSLRLFSDGGFVRCGDADRALYQWWTFSVAPYERHTTKLFAEALAPGAVVLDVGANRGYYAFIAASAVGDAGRVHAFEPCHDNYEGLLRGIRLNGFANVVPVCKAVSEASGVSTLFLGSETGHSLHRETAGQVRATRSIETVSIDEYVGTGRVDVVKIDVQGGEPQVLEGMCRTIRDAKRLTLFVEFCPEYLRQLGRDPYAFLEDLRRTGLSVSAIDDTAGCVVEIGAIDRARIENDPLWYANLLCMKQ